MQTTVCGCAKFAATNRRDRILDRLRARPIGSRALALPYPSCAYSLLVPCVLNYRLGAPMNAACRLSRFQRLIHRLTLVISTTVAAVPALVAAEEKGAVAVGLRSGKVFVGRVDSRANEQQLWLRTSRAGIELRRPIDWENILLVRQGNREFSARNFVPQYYRRRQLPRRCA